MNHRCRPALATVLFLAWPAAASAMDLHVPSTYPTIQSAIDAAINGDTIVVAAGTYTEDLNLGGKAVTVRGAGPDTVIRGSGAGSVVTIDQGEGNGTVLDSLTITGGSASLGGGVSIVDSSPVVVRTVVTENAASARGSGIYVGGPTAEPLIYNNVIMYNDHIGFGDPHGIEIADGAAPRIVNNTIVKNDSNGIRTQPSTDDVVIVNNVIAINGARVEGERRGRGICDFSAAGVVIRHNIFKRNKVAALLRAGRDWRRMGRYQKANPADPRIHSNRDGRIRFVRRPGNDPANTQLADLEIRDHPRSKAIDAGIADPGCNDLDGTTNDLGHTGGPYAAPSTAVPTVASCGG